MINVFPKGPDADTPIVIGKIHAIKTAPGKVGRRRVLASLDDPRYVVHDILSQCQLVRTSVADCFVLQIRNDKTHKLSPVKEHSILGRV